MKKILIMTTLLASSSLLAGCGSISPDTEIGSGSTEAITLETTGVVQTGADKSTDNIKTMIEKRKEQLKTETGNQKELSEKDIQLLESVLNEMTKKK